MMQPRVSVVASLFAISFLSASMPSAAAPEGSEDRTLPSSRAAMASASLHDAEVWIRRGRSALSPAGRDFAEIEIAADYFRFQGEAEAAGQQRLSDVTRLRRSSLWQARDLEGGHLERFFGPSEAWLLTPDGKQSLDVSLRSRLEDYHCLLRLQHLSVCDGLEASVETGIYGRRVWLRFERDGRLFARMGLDRTTALPLLMQYPEEVADLSELAEAAETSSSEELVTTVFDAYRAVDGWMVPHYVQTFRDDQPSSIYKVTDAEVTYVDAPVFAP